MTTGVNHPIFTQLKELGANTMDLTKASGHPFVLVGWHGYERLLYPKGAVKKTDLEEFRKTWRGRKPMEVASLSQAVAAMGVRILTRKPGGARLGRPPKTAATTEPKLEAAKPKKAVTTKAAGKRRVAGASSAHEARLPRTKKRSR